MSVVTDMLGRKLARKNWQISQCKEADKRSLACEVESRLLQIVANKATNSVPSESRNVSLCA